MLRHQALDLTLSEHGEAVLPVAAGDLSMVPHLRGGDLLLVRRAQGAPARGHLIVFRQNDYLVVHRYLGGARTPDGRPCYRTRGDGRSALDPPVLAADVVARAVAVRSGGTWRSLDGPAAGVYARMVAWHDLFWAAAAVAAQRAGLGGIAAALDRGLLRLGAPLVFPLLHRRIAPPGESGRRAAV